MWRFMVDPRKLLELKIDVGCLVQKEDELILLADGTLHAGFNL